MNNNQNALKNLKDFWPKEAPKIDSVIKYVQKYKNDLIVIKYGGNVLIDRNVFNNFTTPFFSVFS